MKPSQFKQDIRNLLWSGKISEDAFWYWLKKQCPSLEIHNAKSILIKQLSYLPAFNCIPDWSQLADIHLLSNHRSEWLEPLLKPIKKYVKSITISSSVGFCKPDREIYEIVHNKLNVKQKVLFIDDQEENLKPAQELFWSTLIADKKGIWIEQVNEMLNTD
ncbi:HAD-IA family hydrolase [Cohnella silvisoli]|uniref:HAD-IA family hydrolase n=1 Tax=Cohnella silvisoli TaxID=2873699 RepID=A0ABV1KQP7_9BACL|nr:HAD-IA family hydrolase [Cohnella silvisoli]MCD9021995.1 HAD-IA family hydrolase [Cohnella silvisoli]